MNSKEIKQKAKEIAFKNKWNILKPYLFIFAIAFILGIVMGFAGIEPESTAGSLITLIFEIAIIPLSVGYLTYILKLVRGNTPNMLEALFSKYNMTLTILIVSILVTVCTAGWTLLLIIPGIIYAYKVIMVYYIMADTYDSETKWSTIISKSKEMMDGHKWEFFVFQLSFIGWYFLVVLTLGIASIWVFPYYQTAIAIYYDELKKLKFPEQQIG